LFVDPVEKISLAVSNLKNSTDYWQGLLKMKVIKQSNKTVELTYGEGQTILELCEIGKLL
jgi:catechol-2,3-dioxygenase